MNVVLAASSREINRVPRSVGKSTAFMLELLSSATTIATPCPAIRVMPPTVCGRASATARQPIASPRKMAGNARNQNQPMRWRRGNAPRLGQEILGRARSKQPGKRQQNQKPEPAGLSKMHAVTRQGTIVERPIK